MAEELRDYKQVSSRLGKERSIGMSKFVEGHLRFDFCNFAGSFERPHMMVLAPFLTIHFTENKFITFVPSDRLNEE